MKHILDQFTRREAHPAIQFIKYGIAGGLATVTHVSIFFMLSIWVFPALLAESGLDALIIQFLGVEMPEIEEATRQRNFAINNWLAFIAGNIVAYLINFHWVFKPGRHRRSVEISLFLVVSTVSLFVGIQIGLLIMQFFDATTTVSQAGNVIAAVMLNFVCRKFIVFKG
jgi:putative flippase GtrA